MNKYDERYDIRLARPSEIDDIMKFINEHWKSGHIMAVDRKLFEYEFLENDIVNVIIAMDKNTRTIEGISGFLRCSHTDQKDKLDVWGSFWKVNDSRKNMTFLGVELIKRLICMLQCRTHLGIGINPDTTLPIRKMVFHEKTAKMEHYYCLNPQIKDFKIAVINNLVYKQISNDILKTKYIQFYSIDEIQLYFDIEKLDSIPYKDFWYINKRFFQHPYYSYQVYGLYNKENKIAALLITRVVEHMGRKVLRIVDYIGEQSLFSGLGYLFQDLMAKYQYEYTDFYTFGFHKDYILNAGFLLKAKEDTNIIPNYFEPFLQKNIDIWIRYTDENTLFCKADGDQDRPNTVRIE